MLQADAALAFTPIAVVRFQCQFPIYPTLLEYYNQEVYSHGKSCLLLRHRLGIEFYGVVSSFFVFIHFLYVPVCLLYSW